MKTKKIILFAFATKDLIRSAERLKKQAIKLDIYDEIKILNEDSIISDNKKILELKKSSKKSRGYGYWFWKPFLILDIMKNLQEGDIIHYLDIGCHLQLDGIDRFREYLDIVENNNKGILAFQYYSLKENLNLNINFPLREEFKYTKADLLDFFSVIDNKEITNTPQFWAGNFFIKKNDFTINFLNTWLNTIILNPNLINDTPSIKKNFEGFIENRHDQSVFSILCKKSKVINLSAYECEWAHLDNQRTWIHLKKKPILAKRDLKYNIIIRFLNRQKKNLNRLKIKLQKNGKK